MLKKLILSACAMLFTLAVFSQGLPLDDSTVIFKDKDGKILKKEQVLELVKGKFSMKTEDLPNGGKIITIIPLGNEEMERTEKENKAYIASLVGKPIEQFKFKDINGKKIRSRKLKGKVIVMNFWFTACKPCIMEMPELNELAKDHRNENVVFIAPALDNRQRVQDFLTNRSFLYRIIPAAQDYAARLNVTNYPTHIIADQNGIIQNVFLGYNADIKKMLSDSISRLLPK